MISVFKDLPFYIIRLWSLYVQYFPPTFTDSWRRAHLLPIALSSLAEDTPDRVYACIPKSDDLERDGFRDVTYRQLLNAVDAIAWWLDEEVFGNEKRGQVFTYIGPRDLRYAIFLLASIKTGRVLFLMSPNMPPSTQAVLFSKIQCQVLLYDPSVKGEAYASQDTIPGLRLFECPSQAHWIDGDAPNPYVYEPSWEEAKDTVVAIFHTSGSTSLPKPINYTNATFVCYDSMYRVMVPPFADKRMEGQKYYTMFPLMHTGGITVSLLLPLYRHTVFVCGLPTPECPSTSSVQTILRITRPDSVLLTPHVISTLLAYNKTPHETDLLTIPSSIGFAGSSLPKSIGDLISQHVVLRNGYGSTESGHFSQFPYSRGTWEYLSFHPLLGVELIPFASLHSQQLYELVIRPHSDPVKRSDFQIIYHTQPERLTKDDGGVFHSSDLWTPHPWIHGLWKLVGRTDDLISLSNGRKVFASAVEEAVKKAFYEEMKLKNKTTSGTTSAVHIEVLLGGHGLSAPYLLVEFHSGSTSGTEIPTQTIQDLHRFVLRRIVAKTNAKDGLMSEHTQIEEDRIICLDDEGKGLKFMRTGKHSVQKGKSLAKYEKLVQMMIVEAGKAD
ncbi:hypothetical protein J3R30DRAFT_1587016 [Lentinula aciculospora]|uniref:AMP-dependent synthetase/ligase domain-containing protein n=1 Tax=Lentinula aciculospora TaxID=153920 RepID=A0A9W9DGC1_9AGAR|nr:hypothetical protein J3R30DRAFT_1587016 [Lentinula aciculospora]